MSEGIYIAARQLFEKLPAASPQVPINDYAPPKSSQTPGGDTAGDQRPATWILVVGHRQFWPLAVLNENTEIDKSADPSHPDYGPKGSSLLQRETPDANTEGAGGPAAALPGEMTGLLAAVVFLGLWHSYCCWKGSIYRSPRARAYFAPIPRAQHAGLVLLGSLVLGLLGVTLFFAVWIGNEMLAKPWTAGGAVCALLIVVSGYLGCLANYRLPVVSGDTTKSVLETIRRWRFYLLVWAWIPAMVLLTGLRRMYLTEHLTIANRIPTKGQRSSGNQSCG